MKECKASQAVKKICERLCRARTVLQGCHLLDKAESRHYVGRALLCGAYEKFLHWNAPFWELFVKKLPFDRGNGHMQKQASSIPRNLDEVGYEEAEVWYVP